MLLKFHYMLLLLCAFVGLESCNVTHLASMEAGYSTISANTAPGDAEMEAQLTGYRQQMEVEMNVIVGTSAESISKGRPESKLGNLMSDIILERAAAQSGSKVDFAVQNLGGIRIPTLPGGEIRRGTIFELMPFDNEIVIVTLSGTSTKAFLDKIAAQGGSPISRGISMRIDNKEAVEVMVGGQPIDPNAQYHIAMPDFMANGGDSFDELKTAPRIITGIFVRDAILDYFLAHKARGEMVKTKIEGRIKE